MTSEISWEEAFSPNYNVNENLLYPYSGLPYKGEYCLVKIPISLNVLIPHIDYWGQGRVESPEGISGFPICYNINQSFSLVSDGPDNKRKIPNRIPVISETECDTSAYVKDNSVIIVTVMEHSVNSSCAADIARIINTDQGIVVTYGSKPDSKDIDNLTEQLKSKNIYPCPSYILPADLQEVTKYQISTKFVNVKVIECEIHENVIKEEYAPAVYMTESLNISVSGNVINYLFKKILNGESVNYNKLMSYAYQLWINGGESIISEYFPKLFKLIFGKEKVKIINKGYNQALKLGEYIDKDGDRIALGSTDHDQNSKFSWQLNPIFVDNQVIFTIFNVDYDMCLKPADAEEDNGDRKTYGSKDCNTNSSKYIVEPFLKQGKLSFHIINNKYRQGLMLSKDIDSNGDRWVFGHKGDIYKDEDSFEWIIHH